MFRFAHNTIQYTRCNGIMRNACFISLCYVCSLFAPLHASVLALQYSDGPNAYQGYQYDVSISSEDAQWFFDLSLANAEYTRDFTFLNDIIHTKHRSDTLNFGMQHYWKNDLGLGFNYEDYDESRNSKPIFGLGTLNLSTSLPLHTWLETLPQLYLDLSWVSAQYKGKGSGRYEIDKSGYKIGVLLVASKKVNIGANYENYRYGGDIDRFCSADQSLRACLASIDFRRGLVDYLGAINVTLFVLDNYSVDLEYTRITNTSVTIEARDVKTLDISDAYTWVNSLRVNKHFDVDLSLSRTVDDSGQHQDYVDLTLRYHF